VIASWIVLLKFSLFENTVIFGACLGKKVWPNMEIELIDLDYPPSIIMLGVRGCIEKQKQTKFH
jgi:hypothetical protein